MLFPAFFAICIALACATIQGADIASKYSDTKLNVHIIPHSHDDPGWLKTADQYYSGTNSSIYTASVNLIFNSVVTELVKNPERTFSFCEVSFFSRWWHEQDVKMKETVKRLFANHQLSFLNGGWVMHDEAASHYVSMIDQTTLGHRFLLEELGYRPRVGWQIDPFGHSSTHAWLSNEVGFDALFFGRIDYQDRTKRFQEKAMEMIWKPSTSDPSAQVFTGAFSDGNYGPPSDFCFDTTCPYCRNDPVVTDPLLQTYNLDSKIAKFIQGIQQEQSITRGNHLMLKLGSDFAYSNAPSWYRSLDVLIDEVNQRDSRYNVFYSDPTSYMKARAQETASQAVVWPEKRDDFFPYSDASHTFWTGYFTSRPQFKYFERYASGFLQMIRQFAVQSRHVGPAMQAQMTKAIAKLSAAVGLSNHHDCITGTEKQHVADDYKRILDAAMQEAEAVFLSSSPVHDNNAEATLPSPHFTTCRLMNETLCAATQTLQPSDAVLVSVYNPLPRTTVTPRLVTVLLAQETVDAADVAVLPMDRAYSSLEAALAHVDGVRFTKAELFPALTLADVYAKDPIYATQAANVRLVFSADALPALSTRHFLVTLLPKSAKAPASSGHALALAKLRNVEGFIAAKPAIVEEFPTLPLTTGGHHFDVRTSTLQLAFDRVTGQLRSITRTRDTASYVVNIAGSVGIGFYNAFGGSASSPLYRPLKKHDTRDPHLQNLQPHPEVVAQGVSTQPSGAYIFRTARANEALHAACQLANDLSAVKTATPSTAADDTAACDTTTALGHVQQMVIVRGTLMAEVHQRFANWASHTYRIVEGDDRVEVEYQLGEIPIDDEVGKEIVYRLDTDLVTLTNDSSTASTTMATPTWFTDSNGREFLTRRYNYRPTWDLKVYEPIAGNYYPLTAAQYMVDTRDTQERSGPVQLSWLIDRSLGGASLRSGSMEVMIQRRLLHDDYKGVEEALNETTDGITHYPDWQRIGRGIPVTGRFHWLVGPAVTAGDAAGTANVAMEELRHAMDDMFYLPALASPFFLPLPASSTKVAAPVLTTSFGGASSPVLAYDLPSNVQLVTCEYDAVQSVLLVRLAHQFAVTDDPAGESQPVTVNLATLFANFKPRSMVELTLSANEDKATQLTNKIIWSATTSNDAIALTAAQATRLADVRQATETMTVTLQPMQIRTLALSV